VATTATRWTSPGDQPGAESLDELILVPGARFPLLDVSAGDPATTGTSAVAYRLWFRIAALDGVRGWVSALRASSETTGVDGRPSAVRFDLLPEFTRS
jgi:hypothetical protein